MEGMYIGMCTFTGHHQSLKEEVLNILFRYIYTSYVCGGKSIQALVLLYLLARIVE